MSVSPALDPGLSKSQADPNASGSLDPRDIDWGRVRAQAAVVFDRLRKSPLTLPGLLAFVGMLLAFFPMIASLPERWLSDEYYTHGLLVPFLVGFIIFKRWPKIQALTRSQIEALPATPAAVKFVVGVVVVAWTWIIGGAAVVALTGIQRAVSGMAPILSLLLVAAVVLGGVYFLGIKVANRVAGFQVTALSMLVALLPLVYASYVGNIVALQGWLFVFVATLAVATVAGWRWAAGLLPGIAFLLFGFPVWNWFIDGYTNWLQLLSTDAAFQLLKVTGFSPIQTDPTTIYLNNFQLNVAVPCSGMKLLLALSAFTTLFVLIANLRFWSNVFMFALVVPLCLAVNGLRIALIGIVGNEYGQEAGMQFHDWSGYITLVVCFYILFKFARLLGWKD